jgi:hypothetical protein
MIEGSPRIVVSHIAFDPAGGSFQFVRRLQHPDCIEWRHSPYNVHLHTVDTVEPGWTKSPGMECLPVTGPSPSGFLTSHLHPSQGAMFGALGRPAEALAAYQQVIDRNGEDPGLTMRKRVERATTSSSDIRGRRGDLTD